MRALLSILVLLVLAVPAYAAVDIAVWSYNISLVSSNPQRMYNEIFTGEYGEFKIDLINLGTDYAYGVAVGFYVDGAQVGDTQYVDVPDRGRKLAGSQLVWNTAGLGGQSKSVTVIAYHNGDSNDSNNDDNRSFYVQQGSATGNITGRVFNRMGQALAGVRVTARNYSYGWDAFSGPSSDTGYYVITGMEPGTRFLIVDSAPYTITWRTGVVVNGNLTTPNIDFYLDTDPLTQGALQVAVQDQYGDPIDLHDTYGNSERYNAVSLATTYIDPSSNEEEWIQLAQLSPADGICRFTRLPARTKVIVGLWAPHLNASGDDYSSEKIRDIIVPANDTLVLPALVTYPAGKIRGIVTDANTGEPLSGMELLTYPVTGTVEEDWNGSSTTTDTRGYFMFDHLRPGVFTVEYEPDGTPGYTSAQRYGVVVESGGGQATCNLTLQPGAEVYGTIPDIGRLMALTGFYPGPNRGLGVAAVNRLTADSFTVLLRNLGDFALDAYVLEEFAQKLNLQTGEYSFDYSYPATGTYNLVPAMWWEEANGGLTVSTFGSRAQASPGAGEETGPVTLAVSTSLGRLTGSITPSTMSPGQIVVWAVPADRSNALAGFANPGLDPATGRITYTLPFVATGTYDVYAVCPGYDSVVARGVQVAQGATRTIDFAFSADTVRPAAPTPAPDGPVTLNLEEMGLEINLVASADNDVREYRVYRTLGADVQGNYSYIGFAPAGMLTYVDDNVETPGVTYRYRITAIDHAGNETLWGNTSLWSFSILGAALNLTAPVGGAQVTVTDQNQITFTWDAVGGVDTYALQLSSSPSGEDVWECETTATSVTYTGSDLTANSTYEWVVEAYNSAMTQGIVSSTETFTWRPAYQGGVTGTITNNLSNPVAGAWVRLVNSNGQQTGITTTSGSGQYYFSGVTPGDYVVVAARYDVSNVGTELSPAFSVTTETVTQNVQFAVAGIAKITGYVQTVNGTPLQNVQVNAVRYLADLGDWGMWVGVQNAMTDSTGYFEIIRLRLAQNYGVSVFSFNNGAYSDKWLPDVPAQFSPTPVQIVLEEGLPVTGLVTDAVTGDPLANATVMFEGDNFGRNTATSPWGSYSVNLVPGEYDVIVRGSSISGSIQYGNARLTDQKVSSGNQVINIRLPRGGTVSGTVDTSAAGTLNGSLMVVAFAAGTVLSPEDLFNDNLQPEGEGQVQAGGVYSVTNLAAGSYDLYPILYSSTPHFDQGEETETIVGLMPPLTAVAVSAATTTTGKNFTLPANGRSISGELRDGGSPVAIGEDEMAAVVFARLDGSFQASASLENLYAGTAKVFRFTGIPDGTYRVLGYADGYDTLSYFVTVGADSAACHLQFTADNSAPAPPVWKSPAIVPAFSEQQEMTLQWTADADADRYGLYRRLGGSGAFTQMTDNGRPQVSGDTATFSDAIPTVDTYSYYLVAYDLAGNAETGTVQYVRALPKAFSTADTTILPDTTTPLITFTPTFTWNAVTGATSYTLYLRTDKGALHTFSGLTATSKAYPADTSVPKLYPGRTYYWAVEALGGSGALSRTGYRSFTILSGLTPPKIEHQRLVSAVPGVSIPVNAAVYAPGGVNTVTLQYGTASGYVLTVMTADTTMVGSYRATIPGTYITAGMQGFYYRIAAVAPGGATLLPAGNPATWSTGEAYYVPVSNAVTVDGFVYLRGTRYPVAQAQLWVRSMNNGPIPVYVTSDASGHFSATLPYGDTYYLMAQKHGYAPTMPMVLDNGELAMQYGVELPLQPGSELPAAGALTCYLDDSPALLAACGWAAGMVHDDFGNPVAGAIIVADRPDTPWYVMADVGLGVSDAAGRYVIPNLNAADSFSLFAELTDNGQAIMRGLLMSPTQPDAPDTFMATATQQLNVRPLPMSARYADEEAPVVLGAVDSGTYGVTVRVSEELAGSVYDIRRYTLYETNPVAAADTPVALMRVDYRQQDGAYLLTVQAQQSLRSGVLHRLRMTGLADWAGNTMSDTEVIFTFDGSLDAVAPRLDGAVAPRGTTVWGEVLVYFSEPLDSTAFEPMRYSIPGLTVNGAEHFGPGQVLLHVTPMVEGQAYTVSCTTVQDVAGNPVAGSTSATFYGANSGTDEDFQLIAVSADEGQPLLAPGTQFLIASAIGSDLTATVTSAHDSVGISVALVQCDPDELPDIVPDGSSGFYAALAGCGSVSDDANDTIAGFSGGLLTITVDSISITLPLSDTRTLESVIHIALAADTVQAVATSLQYPGRVWLAETAVIPPQVLPNRDYSIVVDELGLYQVTLTRLSDLQTQTLYNIVVDQWGSTYSVAPAPVTFPATTDTFGVISGILDRPDTGTALITYDEDGEIERYPHIFAHRRTSNEIAGKPCNPESDLLLLSNGDVKYTIWGLPVSSGETVTYIVEVSAAGYQPASQGVELTQQKKDRTGINFPLRTAGSAVLRGRVTSSIDVEITDLTVTAINGSNGTLRTAQTDRGGYFAIADLAAGDYIVTADATARGYVAKTQRLTIDTGATAMVSFRLEAARTIRGQLLKVADSQPVTSAGAIVEAAPLLAGMEGQVLLTTPAADGTFTFLGIPDLDGLTYRLTANASGYSKATLNGVVPGETNAILAVAPISADITGRVVSPDTGIAGASVRVVSQAVASYVKVTQADATGTYTVSVPGGYYTVELSAPGYRRALLQNVPVIEGQTTDVGAVLLEDGATISGRVTGADGLGVAGALVRAVSPDSTAYLGSALTSANGYYAITGLVKNVSYRVMVLQNGGADVYPYDKLVFLTADATVNITTTSQPPQFFLDCQRSSLGDTVFNLTITVSKRLQSSPYLTVLAGHGQFSTADSKAVPYLDRVYKLRYTEPDTTVTLVTLLVTGTDLNSSAGFCTYSFSPLYEKNQEVVVNGGQSNQITLSNGASIIIPENAYSNANDTAASSLQNSVRLRISQVGLQSSTGGETYASSYYGASRYLTRYAPPVSGTGRWSRSSNDYDIHLQDGTGETVTVAAGKFLTITLPYSDTSGAALTGKLHLYYYNETLGRWVGEVTGQIISVGNSTITISVNHLSKFAVFKEPAVPGDVSGDGSLVNTNDLAAMNVYYVTNNVSGDISGPGGVPDGVVDFYDISQLGQDYNQ